MFRGFNLLKKIYKKWNQRIVYKKYFVLIFKLFIFFSKVINTLYDNILYTTIN